MNDTLTDTADESRVDDEYKDVTELTRELDLESYARVTVYEGTSYGRSLSTAMPQILREAERRASIGGGLPPDASQEAE